MTVALSPCVGRCGSDVVFHNAFSASAASEFPLFHQQETLQYPSATNLSTKFWPLLAGPPPRGESSVITRTSRDPLGSGVVWAPSIWNASSPPWLRPTTVKSLFGLAAPIARSMANMSAIDL